MLVTEMFEDEKKRLPHVLYGEEKKLYPTFFGSIEKKTQLL